MERSRHKEGLNVHPDKVPNWMRGFFDDFKDSRDLGEHDHLTTSQPKLVNYDLARAEAIERSHEERGIGRVDDHFRDLVYEDPYQRQKMHQKFTVERSELERHDRGAFRDETDSSIFTMHPKRAEYRQ